ncbi:15112_t:CDS:1 [Cetraspora pellucida]|uniref:15112_t:CDS:1 n=1 Tax=Cetraspora pellucida TaxID=1433469 RepID=A0ACA9LPF5_9GLOM|nr:15112_t:CDS:1 [Cetraspora pellucida]
MSSLFTHDLYRINEDDSISCLQKDCSYKNRTPKNKHNSIIQHYSRCHKDHYKALKGVNKPYSKPQQLNISTDNKQDKLIEFHNLPTFEVCKDKTLIAIIYRYILLHFDCNKNLNIQITVEERKIFEMAFELAINSYKLIETGEKTLKKNSTLVNTIKNKIGEIETKQKLLDYLDSLFFYHVLMQ